MCELDEPLAAENTLKQIWLTSSNLPHLLERFTVRLDLDVRRAQLFELYGRHLLFLLKGVAFLVHAIQGFLYFEDPSLVLVPSRPLLGQLLLGPRARSLLLLRFLPSLFQLGLKCLKLRRRSLGPLDLLLHQIEVLLGSFQLLIHLHISSEADFGAEDEA